MAEPVLTIDHLSHKFGDHVVVDDISLAVSAGEIYGLVGPDGAGKTTTLRLVCGGFKARRGEVTICGFSITRRAEKARENIGYLSQHFSLYEELTVLENIRFLAETRGMSRGDWLPRSKENLNFVGLGNFMDRRAGQLSGGMKQKLALACALVNRPRLLLLDEPTTGVDPVTRQDFWQLVIRLSGEQGLATLVCTPYMDEAVRCSRIGFLRSGKMIIEGTPLTIRETLRGRVMELGGEPQKTLLQIARSDPAVIDAQRFGDRLHLRVQAGQVEAIKSRLLHQIPAAGGRVDLLTEIAPSLEDVFIEMSNTK